MTIYDNIKEIANNKKISIRQIERCAGISNGSLSKWNVSTPKVLSVRKVAALLDVTVDDLLKTK